MTRDYVTAESFDRFDCDYVAPEKLASEIGTTASFAYHALRKREVEPISDAQGVRMIYRREEIVDLADGESIFLTGQSEHSCAC